MLSKALYIFNPDCDLALAHEEACRRRGLPHAVYTPKPRARQLADALALLPAWYAEAGSRVLVPHGTDLAAAQRWLDDHSLEVEAVDHIPADTIRVVPWGWSNTLCSRLVAQGCPPALLPADVQAFARLSDRRLTLYLHEHLARLLGHRLCPRPLIITAIDEVEALLARHPQGCYVKKLWSGSGQGIMRVNSPLSRDVYQWIEGELARTGAMTCEPAYRRVMDMAVEYRCEQGKVAVDGYAVFTVDEHSQWCGSRVEPKALLHERIVGRYPAFDSVVKAVTAAVATEVPANYIGHLGVDMLLFEANGLIGINPCVEVNGRTTMGVVAAHLGERHAMRGVLRVVRAAEVQPGDTPLTPPSAAFVAVLSSE